MYPFALGGKLNQQNYSNLLKPCFNTYNENEIDSLLSWTYGEYKHIKLFFSSQKQHNLSRVKRYQCVHNMRIIHYNLGTHVIFRMFGVCKVRQFWPSTIWLLLIWCSVHEPYESFPSRMQWNLIYIVCIYRYSYHDDSWKLLLNQRVR